jgi:hypothetical protein
MSAQRREHSPLRLLAPLALALFTVAFVLVLVSSGGGGGGSSGSTVERQSPPGRASSPLRQRRPKAFYTVRRNDTLAAIAVKTGVSLQRLEELNPGLDPQALVAGQRIRLHE